MSYPVSHPMLASAGRQHSSRGFTLIEVLAALLVIGIVLPVAMEGISLAVNAGSSARRRTEAAALAESKLAEIALTPTLTDGSTAGEFGPAHPDYRWNVQVLTRDSIIQEATVIVTWTERGAEAALALSTFIYAGAQQ